MYFILCLIQPAMEKMEVSEVTDYYYYYYYYYYKKVKLMHLSER
jgi:hypothetical protein